MSEQLESPPNPEIHHQHRGVSGGWASAGGAVSSREKSAPAFSPSEGRAGSAEMRSWASGPSVAGAASSAVSGLTSAVPAGSTWAITSRRGALKNFFRPVPSIERTDSTRAVGPSFSRMSATASSAVFTVNL